MGKELTKDKIPHSIDLSFRDIVASHLSVVLDASSSMMKVRSETIYAVNQFMRTQPIDSFLLNTFSDKVIRGEKMRHAPRLTYSTYEPHGMTALLDAIMDTIHDTPDGKKVVFLITTDGYENASRRHSLSEVAHAIREKTKLGWQFIYMSCHHEARSDAETYGIKPENVLTYDREGIESGFHELVLPLQRYFRDETKEVRLLE